MPPQVRTFDLETEQTVVRRYVNGTPIYQIMDDLHAGYWSIRKVLLRNDVRIRSLSEARRRLALNESAFDIVTEEAAYWLGFLMADGSVIPRKGHVAIQLQIGMQDLEHLKGYRTFVGSEAKISMVEPDGRHHGLCGVSFNSVHMAETLSRYGVVPNKTAFAKVQQLGHDRNFWRGLVDGDGCIGWQNRRPRIGLCGSLLLMNQFVEFVHSVCSAWGGSVLPRTATFADVFVTGRSCEQLVEVLYRDCSVALPRKWEKAMRIMEMARAKEAA